MINKKNIKVFLNYFINLYFYSFVQVEQVYRALVTDSHRHHMRYTQRLQHMQQDDLTGVVDRGTDCPACNVSLYNLEKQH